jgi:hypothetical protein
MREHLRPGSDMVDLFARWRGRIDANSRRAVVAYIDELTDFRRVANNDMVRTKMVDFAVFLRERTVALAAEDKPFTPADLDIMADAGRERAVAGISPAAQRHVLLLHTTLTLREVDEAATPRDVDDVMHTMSWLAPQGTAAQAAYTRGYLLGQESCRPVVDRVRMLANLLVTDDPMAAALAANLAMPVVGRCAVVVVRTKAHAPVPEVLEDLLARHWTPLMWEKPDELVAVIPAPAAEEALALARDLDVACAVGATYGQVGELAQAFANAREVSQVAPLRKRPDVVHFRTDLFAELGVAGAPVIDRWLHKVAQQLNTGTDLVATLDAFYRNDMSRSRTAAELEIHPRTLDYRLRRAQDLTGLNPVSVRGVRILSTTVNRVLSGDWTEHG